MANTKELKWRSAKLTPLDISLDRLNPRINILESDTETDIARKLIKYEDILDLAKKIARTGLLRGERPIVVKEYGQYVVLEGNRRICACKLLLSPELIPSEYRKAFPTLAISDDVDRIKQIEVDVSPDRKTAEPILTLRHTEYGIRRWKPVARMRRVKRLLDEGFEVEEVAAELQESASKIRKTIREFRLLEMAGQLKGLTKDEVAKLDDPDLKTNPFTRFFDLAGVKDYFGLSFTPNGTPHILLTRKKFDERLKLVVKAYLARDDFDTRTDPADVLGAEFRIFRKQFQAKPKPAKKPPAREPVSMPNPPAGPPPAPPPQPPGRPDRFFENLGCRVTSNQIRSVVVEIRKVNPDLYPISGTYLLRTLIELCLSRLVTNSGLSIAGMRDPSLTDFVNFSLQNRGKVFPNKRMGDVIDSAHKQKLFDYLNIVAHQQWMSADPAQLKSTANTLRNFIQHVLEDETNP